jgi:hypothetical protein
MRTHGRSRTVGLGLRRSALCPLSYVGKKKDVSTLQPTHCGRLQCRWCSPSTIASASSSTEVHQWQFGQYLCATSCGWYEVRPQRGQVIDLDENRMSWLTSVPLPGLEPGMRERGGFTGRWTTNRPREAWGDRPDSNRRPPGSQPGARPTELRPQCAWTVSNRRPPLCESGALPLSYTRVRSLDRTRTCNPPVNSRAPYQLGHEGM